MGLFTFNSTRAPSAYSMGATPGLQDAAARSGGMVQVDKGALQLNKGLLSMQAGSK